MAQAEVAADEVLGGAGLAAGAQADQEHRAPEQRRRSAEEQEQQPERRQQGERQGDARGVVAVQQVAQRRLRNDHADPQRRQHVGGDLPRQAVLLQQRHAMHHHAGDGEHAEDQVADDQPEVRRAPGLAWRRSGQRAGWRAPRLRQVAGPLAEQRVEQRQRQQAFEQAIDEEGGTPAEGVDAGAAQVQRQRPADAEAESEDAVGRAATTLEPAAENPRIGNVARRQQAEQREQQV
ncbi:Uncharacterised protein [Pseudomonas aeruginosa]|nr:Uncharacterised protein [Pseudomonas aeruginosa]